MKCSERGAAAWLCRIPRRRGIDGSNPSGDRTELDRREFEGVSLNAPGSQNGIVEGDANHNVSRRLRRDTGRFKT